MKVHVPPVLIAAAGFEVQRRMTSRSHPVLRAAAIAVASASAGLGAASVATFAQQRTTVDPVRPQRASTLVTSGPFSVSRNPMYVAIVGVLAAHAFWRGRAEAFVPVVAVWAALDRLQIRPEESVLTGLFGESYAQYAQATPRWLGINRWPQHR